MGAVQNHKAVLHVKNRFSISNMSGDRGKWSRAKGNIWLYTSSVRVAGSHSKNDSGTNNKGKQQRKQMQQWKWKQQWKR